MSILSLADLRTLQPGIDLGSPESITGLIAQVQAWAESPLGAGRPLEITQHREIQKIPYNQESIIQLTRVPVLTTPDVLIEQRQGGPGSWASLPASSYSLDSDTGEVEIWLTSAVGFQIVFDYYSPSRLNNLVIDVRATYSSGWDFTDDTDSTVALIKSVASGLAKFLWDAAGGTDQYSSSSDSISAGVIKRRTVNEHYTEVYDTSNTSATATTASLATNSGSASMQQAIANILYPLKRLQPREFTTMVV